MKMNSRMNRFFLSEFFSFDPTNFSDRKYLINSIIFLFSQEQIYEFYETLQRKSSDSIEQFQSILEVFVSDVLKYRKEIQRLEDSYRR